jgi:hypothetical protein
MGMVFLTLLGLALFIWIMGAINNATTPKHIDQVSNNSILVHREHDGVKHTEYIPFGLGDDSHDRYETALDHACDTSVTHIEFKDGSGCVSRHTRASLREQFGIVERSR